MSAERYFIAVGTNIQRAINHYPAGTTFCLPAGTWHGQTFHTKNNITLMGDCSSPTGATTILDGDQGSASRAATSLTSGALNYYGGDGTTGVTLECLTVQNYGGSKTCPGNGCNWTGDNGVAENRIAEIITWDGWLLTNVTLKNSGGYGAALMGSATLQNSLVTNNYHGGLTVQTRLAGTNGSPITLTGNEISCNNVRGDDSVTDASGMKAVSRADLGGAVQTIQVLNNYVHDNNATGLWCDINCSPSLQMQGNTVINNSGPEGGNGIHMEITGDESDMSDISYNVVNNPGICIYISTSNSVNVHDNNCLVSDIGSNNRGEGPVLEYDCRADSPGVSNNVHFYNNTVTFQSTGTSHSQQITGLIDQSAGGCAAPDDATWSAHNNSYYTAGTTAETHFTWPKIGYNGVSLATIKASPYNSESGSTIQVGNGSVAGCMQIGCTGSGWSSSR